MRMRQAGLAGLALALGVVPLASCAFVPRQVMVGKLEPRLQYPRDSFSPTTSVVFGPFEDRRVDKQRLGVARNKLMMVTTHVDITGDLAGLLERMVRQNFASQGIGPGESSINVRGAILEATTDAEGPDHVWVQVTASISIVHTDTNRPIRHQNLKGRAVTGVTQVSNSAWEDAFIGAVNQINDQIQSTAVSFAAALRPANEGGLPKGGSATGSCAVVHPDGLVLTAQHVIEGARQTGVRLSDGRLLDASVLHADPANDLALLRVAEQGLAYLPLAAVRSAKVGQRVFTFGYPALSVLGEEAKFTEGSISALSGPQGMANFLQVSVPVQPGSSGGALVSEAGELIGVITSTASVTNFLRETGALPQNVNWAVKSEYARALFELPPPTPPAATRDEAISRARAAGCLIESRK